MRYRQATNLTDQSGFSLLEVVFALAIIATVGITMIGMIPSGFDNVRRATDLSIVSRILQSVSSEANAADWEEYGQRFSGSDGYYLYFDDQGNQLEASGGFNHIYTASVETTDTSTGSTEKSSVHLPGDTTGNIPRAADLRKLLVKITAIPGEQGIAAIQTENPSNYSEHFVIVSNFTRD